MMGTEDKGQKKATGMGLPTFASVGSSLQNLMGSMNIHDIGAVDLRRMKSSGMQRVHQPNSTMMMEHPGVLKHEGHDGHIDVIRSDFNIIKRRSGKRMTGSDMNVVNGDRKGLRAGGPPDGRNKGMKQGRRDAVGGGKNCTINTTNSMQNVPIVVGGGNWGAQARPLWELGNATLRRGGFRDKDTRPRVMILMSDTGGGHRASAEALKNGFKHLYGDRFRIDIVDLWSEHTPWPFKEFPKSYSFMVKYPIIWRTNFTMTQPKFIHVPLSTMIGASVGSAISAAFDRYKPNLIISVHPLMQHVPVSVLRRRIDAGIQDPNTSFATVVTDLTTCHNTWFYPDVDRCYVATEESKQQGLKLGMPEEKMRVFGLPIRPAFSYGLPPKRVLKQRLGLKPHTPCVLLVGGGEGMGPVEQTVDAVASQIGTATQLVVVCGRNARLVQKLKQKKYPEGMHVNIQGFVTNMPDIMGACDVIITKAGPGTISEALICGLPLVLNAFVPCQEEGNIPYVTENKVGVFETKPQKVAQIIGRWLSHDGKELKELARRAKALGKPDSLFHIVSDLKTMIKPATPGFVPSGARA